MKKKRFCSYFIFSKKLCDDNAAAEGVSNVSFRQGDAANIPLKDHSIDAVVSFETIEHIDEMLQNQFLQEIDRVLKPDGLLIMSTPNKAVYSDRYHYFNEYHIHEFYHDEFQKFLKRYFPYVHIYQQSWGQRIWLSLKKNQTIDYISGQLLDIF